MLRWGQTNSGEAVTCYEVDWLVTLLPSFRCVQSSLSVCEFCAAEEERCDRSHGQVCANLMSRHPKRVRTIAAMWSTCSFESLRKDLAWWAVTQKTLKNHKAVKIGMCPEQYGIQESIISYYWQVYSTCTQGEKREHSWLSWCVPCERGDGCSPDS